MFQIPHIHTDLTYRSFLSSQFITFLLSGFAFRPFFLILQHNDLSSFSDPLSLHHRIPGHLHTRGQVIPILFSPSKILLLFSVFTFSLLSLLHPRIHIFMNLRWIFYLMENLNVFNSSEESGFDVFPLLIISLG